MAVKTWTGAGADNNWSTGGNWSGGTAPTNGGVDDIIFDGVFPLTGNKNCTLNVSFTALTINFTGYSGQFTFAANLSSGNTTLGASTTYTASGGNPTTYTFTPRNVSSTFTANGNILPTNLFINLNGTTLTFAGNADFGGNLSTAATSHTIKANTGTSVDLRIGGNVSLTATTTSIADPVTIKGYGTSKTYSTSNAATNAKISFVSGSSYSPLASSGLTGTSFLTVETGGQFTVPNSAHTLNINTGTVTLSGFNSSNNNSYFFGLNFTSGGGTIVLSNDTVIKSTITIPTVAMTITSTGSARLLLEGNLLSTGIGTCIIDRLEFSGTTSSNITATSTTNLRVKEFIINKTGGGSVNFNSNGTFALNNSVAATTDSWTHTSGTITQSSTCIIKFTIATNAQINYSHSTPSPFTFRYIEISGGTFSINSQLTSTYIKITPSTTTTYITSSSTFGFTTANLNSYNSSGATRGITLKSGVTYTITAALIMQGASSTSPITLQGSVVGTKAIFNLEPGAIQTVEYVNATDIDSSGTGGVLPYSKLPIYTLGGTLTRQFNWNVGSQPPPINASITVGYTFVN